MYNSQFIIQYFPAISKRIWGNFNCIFVEKMTGGMKGNMDVVKKMNMNNAVERVLHVKGNYTGGILEMTLVIDAGLPKEYASSMAADIAAALRAHSEVFRNVRLNLLLFKGDQELENKVIPFSFLQMSSSFEDYRQISGERSLDALTAALKLFHARSKLIIVLAEKSFLIRNREAAANNMKPFLGKKSLFLFRDDAEGKWRRGEELLQADSEGSL